MRAASAPRQRYYVAGVRSARARVRKRGACAAAAVKSAQHSARARALLSSSRFSLHHSTIDFISRLFSALPLFSLIFHYITPRHFDTTLPFRLFIVDITLIFIISFH